MSWPTLPLLACLLALTALAPDASAQVRRCVDIRGNSVYTDRACASLDAVERAAPSPAGGNYASGFATRGCARSPGALLDGVRGALESRDVNRLASYYHWTGVGTGSARSLMDRLESIARRPLVGAELVYPGPADYQAYTPPPADVPAPETPAPRSLVDGLYPVRRLDVAAPAESPNVPTEPALEYDTDAPTVAAPPASPPQAIRIDQMQGPDDFGSRSLHFSLRRNAGCWWIQL